ncbi:MAG: hypothetical protein ACLUUB_05715 [Collinsella sp.]
MTRRGRRQRDEEWTCKFSKLLRLVVESNNIKLDHLDSDAGILLSAFRTAAEHAARIIALVVADNPIPGRKAA